MSINSKNFWKFQLLCFWILIKIFQTLLQIKCHLGPITYFQTDYLKRSEQFYNYLKIDNRKKNIIIKSTRPIHRYAQNLKYNIKRKKMWFFQMVLSTKLTNIVMLIPILVLQHVINFSAIISRKKISIVGTCSSFQNKLRYPLIDIQHNAFK